MNRCTWCGSIGNCDTKVISGYIVLESCESCEDEIMEGEDEAEFDRELAKPKLSQEELKLSDKFLEETRAYMLTITQEEIDSYEADMEESSSSIDDTPLEEGEDLITEDESINNL